MKFVHPNFLYALFLLVIPIIIHFFNFRRHKIIYFSNIKFLKKVEKQTKSISKLKHFLLLFLRLIAITSLVFAFARPYIPNQLHKKNSEINIVSFYIDNSESMQNMSQNGILLFNAIQTAKNIVNQSSIKTKYLLTTNSLRAENQRIYSKKGVLDALDKIKLSNKSHSIKSIFEFQNRILKDKLLLNYNQYIYISDFQKSSSNLPFENDSTINNKFTPIQIIPENFENIFIDSVWFDTPTRKLDYNNTLNFRLQNRSPNDLENISIKIKINELKRNVLLSVPANSSKIGKITYVDKTDGVHFGTISISDKYVTFDDEFYFSYYIPKKLSIYIINGKNSTNFATTLFSLDSLTEVKTTSENQIDIAKINSSDLLILNELTNISSGLNDELIKFLNQNGSIVIFPSLKSNIQSYNAFLKKINMPILSPLFGEKNLTKINYKLPFYNNIFLKEDKNVSLPTIKKHFPLQTNNNSFFRSLLSFSDDTPFFVKSNKLRIYLASSGINKDFGNFGFHALFSTILLRISENSKNNNPIYIRPNQNNIITIKEENSNEAIISADYMKNNFSFIPFQIKRGKKIEIFTNKTDNFFSLPFGNYVLKNKDKIKGNLSLNRNTTESNLQIHENGKLKKLFQKSGIKNTSTFLINDSNPNIQINTILNSEYWRWFILITLISLILEILLLKILK